MGDNFIGDSRSGRKHRVADRMGMRTDLAKGIDEEGNLIVQDKAGELHAVRSGEISVRGMLGYV